jgi:hypothetical protein
MPLELGVPDGRWMVRHPVSMEVQRVVVLASTQGERADRRARRRRTSARLEGTPGAARLDAPQPLAVPVVRATIIFAEPLEDAAEGESWLARLSEEDEVHSAFAALNRLLAAHRIAAADPYVHEVSPAQALRIIAGFGIGEQVSCGRWLQARELRLQRRRRSRLGRRAAILRSQERLARLLASRRGALMCEELALRARLDLDNERLAHAAGELERALASAVVELEGEPGADLPRRVEELRELIDGVHEIARALMPAAGGSSTTVLGPYAPRTEQIAAHAEVLGHALARLEAALRARAVALAWD